MNNFDFRVEQLKYQLEDNPLYDTGYGSFTFDCDMFPNSHASKICRSYVDNWDQMVKENMGIILSGTLGTGKSFYAASIVNALINKGVNSIIVTTSRLINKIRSAKDTQELLDDLNKFRLVALDDVGAERETDYAIEQIENFVNDRYLKRKPIIITTNFTGEKLRNTPDMRYSRIFDRILVMCPCSVVLTGESKRLGQRKDRTKKMMGILGVDRE